MVQYVQLFSNVSCSGGAATNVGLRSFHWDVGCLPSPVWGHSCEWMMIMMMMIPVSWWWWWFLWVENHNYQMPGRRCQRLDDGLGDWGEGGSQEREDLQLWPQVDHRYLPVKVQCPREWLVFLSNIFALRGDGQEAKAKDPLCLWGHRDGKLKPQKEKREMLRDQRGELDHLKRSVTVFKLKFLNWQLLFSLRRRLPS